jgi:regulator of cell morphogenesis and NO signaling
MIRLENLIEKVFLAHGQNHPELEQVSEVFAWLSSELKPHMFKEEHMLFPYIIVLEVSMSDDQPEPDIPLFGTVQNPIRMMMSEHDRAGELLRELRNLTSNYTAPADGCISYRALYQALEAFEKDLHQHIHLENNVLFPRAAQLEESRRSSERQVSGLSSAERFKSVAGKESVDLTLPMRP